MDRYEIRRGSCTTGASFFSQRTVGGGLPATRQKSSAVWPRDVVMLFMGASRRMKKGPLKTKRKRRDERKEFKGDKERGESQNEGINA